MVIDMLFEPKEVQRSPSLGYFSASGEGGNQGEQIPHDFQTHTKLPFAYHWLEMSHIATCSHKEVWVNIVTR